MTTPHPGRIARAAAWLVRAWGYLPLSGSGVAVGLAAWGALAFYGRGESDFVIRAASVAGLVVLAVSVLGVTLAGLALYRHLRRHAREQVEGRLEVGAALETGLRFPRFGWWPLVQVELRWLDPAAVEVVPEVAGGAWVERVVFRERGRPPRVERAFTVYDVFGLARLTFTRRAPAVLEVLPARSTVDLSAAIRNAAGDGHAHPAGETEGDLIEMRRYAPGDPVRLILWKAYARTRRLMVRMPERAVAPQPSTVAYFVAGPDDEPSATVARTFVEAGLLGPDFTFGADGLDRPATDPADAVAAIVGAVHHRAEGGAGLAGFLDVVPRERLGRCIVFLPGAPGPWRAHLAGFVEALPSPPTLIVTADGRLARPADRWRWLRRPVEVSGPDLRALPALCDALRQSPVALRVFHAGEGRLLSEADVESLRRA